MFYLLYVYIIFLFKKSIVRFLNYQNQKEHTYTYTWTYMYIQCLLSWNKQWNKLKKMFYFNVLTFSTHFSAQYIIEAIFAFCFVTRKIYINDTYCRFNSNFRNYYWAIYQQWRSFYETVNLQSLKTINKHFLLILWY